MKRFLFVLIGLLCLLSSCSKAEQAPEWQSSAYNDKLNTYFELNQVIFSEEEPSLKDLAEAFYSTFYPNNQKNLTVISFAPAGLSEVEKKIRELGDDLKAEPALPLDESSSRLLQQAQKALAGLQEITGYYKEKTYQTDSYEKAAELFTQTDQAFISMDAAVLGWSEDYKTFQKDLDQTKITYYKTNGDLLNELTLQSLTQADILKTEFDYYSNHETYNLEVMQKALVALNPIPAELTKALSDKDQLKKSGFSGEQIQDFSSKLSSLYEAAATNFKSLAANAQIDRTRIELFLSEYTDLIAIYNQK